MTESGIFFSCVCTDWYDVYTAAPEDAQKKTLPIPSLSSAYIYIIKIYAYLSPPHFVKTLRQSHQALS